MKQTDVMLFHRQRLIFVNFVEIPLEPVGANLHRGSLQYVFGSELLQTPIQLLKITNAEAQVPQELSPTELITSSQHRNEVKPGECVLFW